MKKLAVALMCVTVAAGCSQLDFGLDSNEPEWGYAQAARAASSSQKPEPALEDILAAWDFQAHEP